MAPHLDTMLDFIVLGVAGIVLVGHAPLIHGKVAPGLDHAQHLGIDGATIWGCKGMS